MLYISTCLAAISLASASAKIINKNQDGLNMTCDTTKKSVVIKTDRPYDEGVEDDIQDLLHSRVLLGCDNEFANLRGRRVNGQIKPEPDFFTIYKFYPETVTFNDVVYELKNGVMKITSNAQNPEISGGCTACFELVKKICMDPNRSRCILPDKTNYDNAPNKLIIEGNFESIPKGFFYGVHNLKTVDMTNSKIKEIPFGAFRLCGDLKEINVNPEYIQIFTLSDMNIVHYERPFYETNNKKYKKKYIKVHTPVPGAINGNIQQVIENQCQRLTEENKAAIDKMVAEEEQQKLAKKQGKDGCFIV